MAEAVRIADSEYHIPYSSLICAALSDGLQIVQIHPQDCKVSVGIATDNLRQHFSTVVKRDADFVGTGHHMTIGEYEPLATDNNSRAQRVEHAFTRHIAAAEKSSEKGIIQQWMNPLTHQLAGIDIHY